MRAWVGLVRAAEIALYDYAAVAQIVERCAIWYCGTYDLDVADLFEKRHGDAVWQIYCDRVIHTDAAYGPESREADVRQRRAGVEVNASRHSGQLGRGEIGESGREAIAASMVQVVLLVVDRPNVELLVDVCQFGYVDGRKAG